MNEVLVLSVAKLEQEGVLSSTSTHGKSLEFRGESGASIFTARLDLDWSDAERGLLTLRFQGGATSATFRIDAVRGDGTASGESSWWMICPATKGGAPCGRRVAKLFLPSAGGSFGCRFCHGLSYGAMPREQTRTDRGGA
ncbi:hypothetical protein Pan216_26720 [Planctomycetes bacterium Pan216]|uniref:Uncharacterized protein n=1 Tax=Kolteria novifilia TaxID=2527975 RepID=A0A518B4A6_9BACT|nr:hypothetical protein Pan216_26720 [Planctomycetes bacterium Pan216]